MGPAPATLVEPVAREPLDLGPIRVPPILE